LSLPAFSQYVNPLLTALRKLGGAARPQQVFQTIARDLAVSSDVREERQNSGASKFENQIAWARWYLVDDSGRSKPATEGRFKTSHL
jgi:restriction system protein